MNETLTIITNHQPREILDASELSEADRAEFDYIDWDKIDKGEDSASFVRYKGETYDLGEFEAWSNPSSPLRAGGWDAMRSDSYFSGLLVRYVPEDDYETVVMGRYYC